MNKNDLKSNMMVVLDNGDHALIVKDLDMELDSIVYNLGYDYLNRFHDDLTCDYGKDIIEVYVPGGAYAIWQFFKGDYKSWNIIWERKSSKKRELEKRISELEETISEIKNELSELDE